MSYQVRKLFLSPLGTSPQWGVILVIAMATIFVPQIVPNDWELNAVPLLNGLNIYHNANYVYPPWGLILLWPYYGMSAAGSRILTVLVLGWFTHRRRWTLARFLAIAVAPFFLFAMTLSNVDILVTVLPVLLWEVAEDKRWEPFGRGLAVALLLLKPQSGVLVVLYWAWKQRKALPRLFGSAIVAVLIVLPINLLGSPPLAVQWFNNLSYPSADNVARWERNNVSLTAHVGLPGAASIVVGALLLVYWLRGKYHRLWTENHTYGALLLASMLVSPYASHQGIIAPLTFTPSWLATASQYIVIVAASTAGVYKELNAWLLLLCGIIALWLYNGQQSQKTTPSN